MCVPLCVYVATWCTHVLHLCVVHPCGLFIHVYCLLLDINFLINSNYNWSKLIYRSIPLFLCWLVDLFSLLLFLVFFVFSFLCACTWVMFSLDVDAQLPRLAEQSDLVWSDVLSRQCQCCAGSPCTSGGLPLMPSLSFFFSLRIFRLLNGFLWFPTVFHGFLWSSHGSFGSWPLQDFLRLLLPWSGLSRGCWRRRVGAPSGHAATSASLVCLWRVQQEQSAGVPCHTMTESPWDAFGSIPNTMAHTQHNGLARPWKMSERCQRDVKDKGSLRLVGQLRNQTLIFLRSRWCGSNWVDCPLVLGSPNRWKQNAMSSAKTHWMAGSVWATNDPKMPQDQTISLTCL